MLLGKGLGGKVKKISDTTVIKYADENIMNLNECIFLSTYNDIPFISHITKITHGINKLRYEMTYAGVELFQYMDTISFHDRLEMLPDLMLQLSRILIFLNDVRIIHCDIKLENICIDKSGLLTLIDFGLCHYIGEGVTEFTPKHYGTKEYVEPIKCGRALTNKSDVFATAITLYIFLYKKYPEYELYGSIMHEIEFVRLLQLDKIKDNIIKYHGYQLYDIFESMLAYDANNRIDARDIYYDKIFDNIRSKYPLASIPKIKTYMQIYDIPNNISQYVTQYFKKMFSGYNADRVLYLYKKEVGTSIFDKNKLIACIIITMLTEIKLTDVLEDVMASIFHINKNDIFEVHCNIIEILKNNCYKCYVLP